MLTQRSSEAMAHASPPRSRSVCALSAISCVASSTGDRVSADPPQESARLGQANQERQAEIDDAVRPEGENASQDWRAL